MNTLFSKVRKSLALLSIGALLSTMVVVSTASAAWYDSAVERLGDASYQSMSADARAAALSAMSSRQDAAVVLHRALGSHASSLTAAELPFSDAASIAPYALNAVASLYEAGVLKGNADGTLRPAANLNRAEVVVMLDRAGLLGEEMAEVSPAIEAEFAGVEWAFDAFRRAAADGTVQGYPDGTWRPAGPVNKAEVFVLADRANSSDFAPVEDDEEAEEDDEEEEYDVDSPLRGGAGTIDIAYKTADTVDEVADGNSARVYSFEIEAQDSDVALSHVKLDMKYKEGTGNSNRLERYIDEVRVYQGNREIGSADVSEFTRRKAGEYTRTIAIDGVVREGKNNKAVFFVELVAISGMDSNNLNGQWSLYASNFRYEDATGVVSTDPEELRAKKVSFEDIAKTGDLRFSKGANNPEADPIQVSERSRTEDVLVNEFNITAPANTYVDFQELGFDVDVQGNKKHDEVWYSALDSLTLKRGNRSLGKEAFDAGEDGISSVKFDVEDRLKVEAGETVTLQVYATFNQQQLGDEARYAEGSTIKVSVNKEGFTAENVNLDEFTNSVKGSANGNEFRLSTVGMFVTFVEANAQGTNQDNAVGTFSIEFKVEAFGDDVVIARDDFVQYLCEEEAPEDCEGNLQFPEGVEVLGNGVTLQSNAKKAGDTFTVYDGETKTFTITVFAENGEEETIAANLRLLGIPFNTTNTTDNYAFDLDEFETRTVSLSPAN